MDWLLQRVEDLLLCCLVNRDVGDWLLLRGRGRGRKKAQRLRGRDIACGESVALAHDDAGRERHYRRDGVTAVDGECVARIVHDRAEVVRANVVTIGDVLVEVVLHARDDLGKVDGDEQIAIFAALFVPQANDMADLVDRPAAVAAGREINELLPSAPADLRRTAAA